MPGYLDRLSVIAGDVGALLKDPGETVSVAESSSGGLVSVALISIAGASSYFIGGGVIYSTLRKLGALC